MSEGKSADLHDSFLQHYKYYEPEDVSDSHSSQSIEELEAAAQIETPTSLPFGQHVASAFYPINPPSIPLAVKGPCEPSSPVYNNSVGFG